MSNKRSDKVRVLLLGGHHYIEVPSNCAMSLRTYLQEHNIPSRPPQAFTGDTDSIELGRGLDIKAVQALLDQWS